MFVSTKNNVLLQTARAQVSRVEIPGIPQNIEGFLIVVVSEVM